MQVVFKECFVQMFEIF